MPHDSVAELVRYHARQFVLVGHERDEFSSEHDVTARKTEGVRIRNVDEVKLKFEARRRQVFRESVAYFFDISRQFLVANKTYLGRHALNYQLAENRLLFG